jgi:hypothetical protein
MTWFDLATGDLLRRGVVGHVLPGTEPLTGVTAADITRLAGAALAIRFDKFSDGRGFTAARHVREVLGFDGPLVAQGHIIPDPRGEAMAPVTGPGAAGHAACPRIAARPVQDPEPPTLNFSSKIEVRVSGRHSEMVRRSALCPLCVLSASSPHHLRFLSASTIVLTYCPCVKSRLSTRRVFFPRRVILPTSRCHD